MRWVLRNALFLFMLISYGFEKKKTFTFKKLKFYENAKQIFDFDHNFDFPDHFLNNNNNKQWYVIKKQWYVTTTTFYFQKCNCFY